MTKEKLLTRLTAAQGTQGKSRDKGELCETCNPRTKTQHGEITRFKISKGSRVETKPRGKEYEKRQDTDSWGTVTGFKAEALKRLRRNDE